MNLNHIINSIILCIIIVCLSASNVHADQSVSSIYYDCVLGSDFGDTDRKTVTVQPIGKICYQRCAAECQSFSRSTTSTDPNVKGNPLQQQLNGDGQAELNSDIIDSCMLACQQGSIFSSPYRERNPDSQSPDLFIMKPAATTQVYCGQNSTSIDSPDYAFFNSGFTIDPTKSEQITITLLNPGMLYGNTVYMCGFKTLKLYPAYRSYYNTDWANNAQVWQSGTSPTNWHARNPYWIDTGIDLKDGDQLTIIYSGNFFSGSSVQGGSLDSTSNYILQARQPAGGGGWQDGGTISPLPGDKLQVITASISGDDCTGNEPKGCKAEYTNDPQTVMKNNQRYIWNGLMPSTYMGSRNIIASTTQNPNVFSLIANRSNSNLENYRTQIFSGTLTGFSTEFGRLGVRHNVSTPINSALGGFDVDISWRGCPYTNGDRLQYAIVPPDTDGGSMYSPYASTVQWYDVPQDALQNNSVFAPQGSAVGNLFFRINKLPDDFTAASNLTPICDPSDPVCQDSNNNLGAKRYQRYQTSGQYFISIVKEKNQGPVTSTIGSVVNSILNKLFGTDQAPGVVPQIFNTLVTKSDFVQGIRALLVLYIAYTGLTFMLGISQINQREAVVRIVKIGVIVTLTSQNSWDFFSNNLLNLFTQGSLVLIAKITVPMYQGTTLTGSDIEANPSIIFSVFDTPFQQLFSKQVWIKIYAVLFTNLLGFVLAVVVIFAVIIYVICIARALMIYLTSVLGIAILFLVAPIFISFILFKYTKTMFDAWIKMLISFALQPVFVFTSIAMFNVVLLACLYTTLSFTACKTCFLGFYIPVLVDICIIPGYSTIAGSHYPPSDPLGAPIWTLSAALAFLIIAQGMYAFCGFCSSLANTIATGSFVGVELAHVAQSANPITNIGSILGYATGTDRESRQYRQGIKDTLSSLGGKKDSSSDAKRDSKDKDSKDSKDSKISGKWRQSPDSSGSSGAQQEENASNIVSSWLNKPEDDNIFGDNSQRGGSGADNNDNLSDPSDRAEDNPPSYDSLYQEQQHSEEDNDSYRHQSADSDSRSDSDSDSGSGSGPDLQQPGHNADEPGSISQQQDSDHPVDQQPGPSSSSQQSPGTKKSPYDKGNPYDKGDPYRKKSSKEPSVKEDTETHSRGDNIK